MEVGIDALLSPTHLILFSGALILTWNPVRAAAARQDQTPTLALGAAAVATSLMVFFIEHIFFLSETWIASVPFEPKNDNQNWEYVSVFLASAAVQITVLLGPLLLVVRRWQLPIGSATVIWDLAALGERTAFSHGWSGVQAAVVGGLVFDLTNWFAPFIGRELSVATFFGPAAAFATYFLIASGDQGIARPTEA